MTTPEVIQKVFSKNLYELLVSCARIGILKDVAIHEIDFSTLLPNHYKTLIESLGGIQNVVDNLSEFLSTKFRFPSKQGGLGMICTDDPASLSSIATYLSNLYIIASWDIALPMPTEWLPEQQIPQLQTYKQDFMQSLPPSLAESNLFKNVVEKVGQRLAGKNMTELGIDVNDPFMAKNVMELIMNSKEGETNFLKDIATEITQDIRQNIESGNVDPTELQKCLSEAGDYLIGNVVKN